MPPKKFNPKKATVEELITIIKGLNKEPSSNNGEEIEGTAKDEKFVNQLFEAISQVFTKAAKKDSSPSDADQCNKVLPTECAAITSSSSSSSSSSPQIQNKIQNPNFIPILKAFGGRERIPSIQRRTARKDRKTFAKIELEKK